MIETAPFSCQHPGCKTTGVAERMWNLKGNPRVIICGKHAFEARKLGLKTFRLSDTLSFEAKKASAQKESEAFFSKFKKSASRGMGTLGEMVGPETVALMKRATV